MSDDYTAADGAADETAHQGGGSDDNSGSGEGGGKKRRRRRRGKRGGSREGAEGTGGEATATERAPSADLAERLGEREEKEEHDDRGDRGGRGGKKSGKKRSRRRSGDDKEPERHRKEKSTNFTEESFAVEKTFADLGLKQELVDGLTDAGFVHPTHIQAQLVPLTLTGVDVLGQAKTGTGKTLAFALPILSMAEPGVPFQALILAPTRELAIQIRQDFDEVGGMLGVSSAAVYGGQSINVQAARLAERPEIIVGTPGRVMDMVGRGYMTFNNVRFAVLDEVDRMFDFGFRDDMKKILSQCPRERQTVFVSATLTEDIERMARGFMQNAEKLVVASSSLTVEMVEQEYVTCLPWDKKRMLAHVLTHEDPALTLVFCRMKRTVDSLVRYLDKKGIDAHAIHGDLSQAARNKVMERFRSGSLSVLVASDLASRGIDVEGITHVVNYDLPDDPDVYVHRIGRTARAGREGTAWSLVTPEEGKILTEIENLINAEIPRKDYADFEATERPEGWRDEPKGGRPIYKVEGVSEDKKSRHEGTSVDEVKSLGAEKLAEKFPGGIVPGKMPKKRMGGRTKTRGGR
ncbi:MAG: hypothetical protein DHS20C14_17190 [Phycisphaeraceae bacterium]|nr:MAG: hypothetical protein DHS20C14_17190 [Phycisphaeraceae bacterium]